MAYDLHIVQADLNLEKWLSFVSENSDLKIQHQVEAINPFTNEIIIMQTPNSAISTTGIIYQFNEREDEILITISSPDDEDIPSLKIVANELGGILIGDEGEEY
ncbi:hypothetical protein TYM08_P2056 [Marinicellulosiphila megalodicopiae]